jgi:hypothetical protein
MKTVRILGSANNLGEMPRTPTVPDSDGHIVEVWAVNDKSAISKHLSRIEEEGEWTRWFNLHSRQHMDASYPRDIAFRKQQDGSKPFYTQLFQPDLPGSIEFPRKQIQAAFPEAANYFSCSICWLIALAILEGFERIEFWGVRLSDRKKTKTYHFERPCFFYWVQKARDHGIDVWYQKEVEEIPFEPGDPTTYDGPLYGYDTKSEVGWDPVTKDFINLVQ